MRKRYVLLCFLAMCDNAAFHQDWQDLLDVQGEIRFRQCPRMSLR